MKHMKSYCLAYRTNRIEKNIKKTKCVYMYIFFSTVPPFKDARV